MDDLDDIQCEDYYNEEPPLRELHYQEFLDILEINKHDTSTKAKGLSERPRG